MSEPEWIESRHFTTGEIMDAGRMMGLSFPPEMELGAAWSEAEAALPEGWYLVQLGLLRLPTRNRPLWLAIAAMSMQDGGGRISGEASTPAAALRALAAKLKERAG